LDGIIECLHQPSGRFSGARQLSVVLAALSDSPSEEDTAS
jgi:hypothetical protein